MHALSQRQAQILDFVVECLSLGTSPTHAEIADEFAISRQTATGHLDALVAKGWLRRSARHRSLEATDVAWRRALNAEEQQAGRKAGGVGARAAVAVRVAARGVAPDRRQALIEFALA